MKTAISIPDEVFDAVEQRVRTLGLTRSQFYARAAVRYLEHLDAANLIEQIDAAIDLAGDDDSNAAAVAAGRRLLSSSDGDW